MCDEYFFCFKPQSLEDDLIVARRRLHLANRVAKYLAGKETILVREFLSVIFSIEPWNLTLEDVTKIGECFGFDPYTVSNTVFTLAKARKIRIASNYRLERPSRD